MSSESAESLNAQFRALHAERERSWDTEKLRRNIDQRRALVAAFDPEKTLRVGDRIEPFELLDVTGATLTLDRLLARGPAVLVFFRFAGCPACNLALPYYHSTLWPHLTELGIPLVAISPQVPERLGEIRSRHGLGFHVASDPDNRLGRRFGITFEPEERPEPAAGEPWIGELTGTGTWELPQPAAIVIDPDRIARFVSISPDWLVRTETPEILAAVRRLGVAAAA